MTQAAFDNEVRLFVYRHFASQQRAPSVDAVTAALGTSTARVREAFERLAAAHVLVLQPDSREVWMAMPFSAIQTSYRVASGDGSWWANCAWDALGVPAMLGQDATIHTHCPVSRSSLEVRVTSGQLEPGLSGLVHFAVPAARWWDDIGYT